MLMRQDWKKIVSSELSCNCWSHMTGQKWRLKAIIQTHTQFFWEESFCWLEVQTRSSPIYCTAKIWSRRYSFDSKMGKILKRVGEKAIICLGSIPKGRSFLESYTRNWMRRSFTCHCYLPFCIFWIQKKFHVIEKE